MSFVPEYQWLTEFNQLKCGGCDKIYLNGEAPNEFQVRFTPEIILDENFDGNNIAEPMGEISFGGSAMANGIVFDLDVTDTDHFVHSFSFFYNGVPYSFVFAMFSGITDPNQYIVTQHDGFTLVRVNTWFHTLISDTFQPYENYQIAFNAVMNQYGVYWFPGGSPTIALWGFPDDTQVTYNPSSPITDGLCGGSGNCATWTLVDFIPVDNQLCFFQTAELDGSGINSPYIQKEIVIPANKRVIITVDFTNSFADPIDMQMIIMDDSMNVLSAEVKVAPTGTNTLIFNYDTGLFPPTSYLFKFEIVPVSGDEIAEAFTGFCFNEIKVEAIDKLYSITALTCDQDDPQLDIQFEETYNGLYNSLITVDWSNAGILTAFQIKLIDTDSNTWTSILYEFAVMDCTKRNYMDLKWWSDCKFFDLDYKNLPFVNECYIQGYSVKLPKVNKERIINTLSNGELQQIYNHSLRKRQFNIGLYTETWIGTLERAFEHKFIEIDSISYTQDTDSDLVPKPENDRMFTSRIDLIEVGSAVVSTACCCD